MTGHNVVELYQERIERIIWLMEEMDYQQDERYHGPLIENEVDVSFLGYSCIALFISAFLMVICWQNDGIGYYKVALTVCFVINILGSLLAWFAELLPRVSYCLIALNFFTIIVDMDFIGLAMFSGTGIKFSKMYTTSAYIYLLVILLVFLLSSAVYSWYYLPKNQGKMWKISQWETWIGHKPSKKQNFLINFLITLGVVVFGSSILTGVIVNLFGLFLGVLLTSTLSAVIVDALYAIYYMRQHPDYY